MLRWRDVFVGRLYLLGLPCKAQQRVSVSHSDIDVLIDVYALLHPVTAIQQASYDLPARIYAHTSAIGVLVGVSDLDELISPEFSSIFLGARDCFSKGFVVPRPSRISCEAWHDAFFDELVQVRAG